MTVVKHKARAQEKKSVVIPALSPNTNSILLSVQQEPGDCINSLDTGIGRNKSAPRPVDSAKPLRGYEVMCVYVWGPVPLTGPPDQLARLMPLAEGQIT